VFGSNPVPSTSVADAVANNDHFGFSIKSSIGYQTTITGIGSLTLVTSSSGPEAYALIYSTDTNFSSYSQVATITGFRSTNTVTNNVAGFFTGVLATNPIVVPSNTRMYFRLVGWGGTAAGGTGRILGNLATVGQPDFTLLGSVTNMPVQDLIWNGSDGGLWSSASGEFNWKKVSDSSAASFNELDVATFTNLGTVEVVTAGVTAKSVTNNVPSGTFTFKNGPITTATLVKAGAGILVFSNAPNVDHSISQINLNSGTILIRLGEGDTNNNALGGPGLTISAGAVFDQGNSSYDILRNLSGSGTIRMTNLIANTNPLNTNALVPNNDIHLRNSSNTVFAGSFEGLGQLTIDSGTITLTGTNVHTGGTWISNGATLRLSTQASLPVQTQKSLTALDSSGNSYYTNGVFEVVDLRLSRPDTNSTSGVMGTLELDDSRITNLVLNRSIGSTRTADIFRVTAGTNSACTLELNAPINLKGHLSGYNAANGGGYVILRGTNRIQGLDGVMLERGGRILIGGSQCVAADPDAGTWAPITFLDDSGYARFGLAPEVTGEVSLPSTIFANTNSTGTNRHAAILLSTNSVNGAPQVLRLLGGVAGVGGLRLASPGNGDVGYLYLSSGNSYEGGTRIGTGKLFVPSADALGNTNNLKPASIGLIRFETRSDSHLVTTEDIDFPETHSIAIAGNNMANLDSSNRAILWRGSITNFDTDTNGIGGHLRKLGSGTLTLLGTNGYTGITRVSQGTLVVGAPASLPVNNRVQFGPSGTLQFAAAGSYPIGSISPVVITNSVGTTNTETMAGVLDLGVSGVNVTVASVPVWPVGSTLRVANLANGSVKLPTSITSDQLAMIKSAENAALYAGIDASGNLSFSSTPPVPAGQTFSNWSGGAAITSNLVSKYGIGGATNSSAASEAITSAVGGSTLSITAVVRTNDTKLSVVGEAATGLTNWTTNGVTITPSANTSGVPDGCQRRVFSVNRGTDDKKFLRLKTSLQP